MSIGCVLIKVTRRLVSANFSTIFSSRLLQPDNTVLCVLSKQSLLFNIQTIPTILKRIVVTSSSSSEVAKRMKTDKKVEEANRLRVAVISHLCKYVEFTTAEATLALCVHPQLKNIKPLESCALIDFFEQKTFVRRRELKEYPWLLLGTVGEVEEKLWLIEMQLGKLRMANLFFLGQDLKVLKKILSSLADDQRNGIDRIEYLTHELESNEAEMSQLLLRHAPLFLMNFSRIRDIMELLKSNDVSAHVIRRDLWIFRHNQDRMEKRLRKLNDVPVSPIHTWMLRCTEDVFTRCVAKWEERLAVFQEHAHLSGYLAERLQRSEEKIKIELIERNPFLLSVNPTKVKGVLDFLFDQGFTPDQVCTSARVFAMSVDSLKQRLVKLAEFGYKPDNLNILCVQWKSFDQYINKLKRMKQRGTGREGKREAKDARFTTA